MLLKINDKRESSIKILKDIYGRQEIPDFKTHVKKGINGTINIEEANGLNGYIYMIDAIYYDRIENQYLLDISDENIERLTKDCNIEFIVNIHSYEDNDLSMFPKNYFTIDIVDIKPKRFVDVKIKEFGTKEEELSNVDIMNIPNEILDVCDLLSGKYDKIIITLNSECTISEISVEKTNDEILGIQFIQRDLYSKTKDAPYYFLFKQDLDLAHNRDEGDYFPVYKDNFSIPIINLKTMGDRINDLCIRLKHNHKESNI